MDDGWQVVSTERLTLTRTNRIANMYVLSPFVWRTGDGFHMLVRAVPRRDDEPRLKMSEIWYGASEDGRHFTMEIAPTLYPGPDLIDLDGCEDPTVLVAGDGLRVWYTGYNANQKTGRLLLARGPDRTALGKAGIVLESHPGFENPKEAALAKLGSGKWRLFFEFSRDDASVIGRVDAAGLDGPWTGKTDAVLAARPDRWDGWHMSAGPIVADPGGGFTMFYNGGTRDARWRIGWATFDADGERLITRCDGPLIEPDADLPAGANDMAFAASAIRDGSDVLLYYSQADQDLRVARLRPCRRSDP